ncbi:hypothetical protein J6P52_05250, partial [bacterium]|nr:hypothetical protein [bacterium]
MLDDEEFDVDELEELEELVFQVNEILSYDKVTPGICAFSSSVNEIVLGKETFSSFAMLFIEYELLSISIELVPSSDLIALIIALVK